MALSKASAGTTTKAIFVHSSSAGSSGTVYTVPEGKVFKGFIIPRNNTSQITININSDAVVFQFGANGENSQFNVTLPPKTVVGNNGTNYFTITGELVDGS